MPTNNIFIGRKKEKEDFSNVISQLSTNQETKYNVFPIYGIGGMGKTSLCRQFEKIALEYSNLKCYYIDWEYKKGITANPKIILDVIYQELRKDFEKEFKPYTETGHKIELKEKEIYKIKNQHPEWQDSFSEVVGVGTEIASGNKLVSKAAQTSTKLSLDFISWVKSETIQRKYKIKPEDVDLVNRPNEHLAKVFIECLAKITEKKKLVWIFDTCEVKIITTLESWLKINLLFPLLRSNPNFVLVYASRDNTNNSRTIQGMGWTKGFADEEDLKTYPINISEFSQQDIKAFLQGKNDDYEKNQEIVEMLQKVSQGIPLAVDILYKALKELEAKENSEAKIKEFINSFKGQDGQYNIYSDIINEVAERFLKYSAKDPEDRKNIYTLAILDDKDVLAKVWQEKTQGVDEIIKQISDRYAIIVDNKKLHDKVKEFIQQDLIQKDMQIVKEISQTALGVYKQKLEDEGQGRAWKKLFNSPDWLKASKSYYGVLSLARQKKSR